jgi:hypothetical protein
LALLPPPLQNVAPPAQAPQVPPASAPPMAPLPNNPGYCWEHMNRLKARLGAVLGRVDQPE